MGATVSSVSRKASRRCRPRGVPPGSQVVKTSMPRARKSPASIRSCVDLPLPSIPSKVMNFPFKVTVPVPAGVPV